MSERQYTKICTQSGGNARAQACGGRSVSNWVQLFVLAVERVVHFGPFGRKRSRFLGGDLPFSPVFGKALGCE